MTATAVLSKKKECVFLCKLHTVAFVRLVQYCAVQGRVCGDEDHAARLHIKPADMASHRAEPGIQHDVGQRRRNIILLSLIDAQDAARFMQSVGQLFGRRMQGMSSLNRE